MQVYVRQHSRVFAVDVYHFVDVHLACRSEELELNLSLSEWCWFGQHALSDGEGRPSSGVVRPPHEVRPHAEQRHSTVPSQCRFRAQAVTMAGVRSGTQLYESNSLESIFFLASGRDPPMLRHDCQ